MFWFFLIFFPWSGKPIELAYCKVLLAQVASRIICSFFRPWLQMWRSAIPVPSLSSPKERLPNFRPSPAAWRVSPMPSAVWMGLQWSGAETSSHRHLPKNARVGHLLPTLVIFQALVLVVWWGEHWHYQAFSLPLFTLVGGWRKHKQCLSCTYPGLSLVSAGSVITWHLCYWDYPSKMNKLRNINSTCL